MRRSRIYLKSTLSLIKGNKTLLFKKSGLRFQGSNLTELPDKFSLPELKKISYTIKKKAILTAHNKEVPVIELRGNSIIRFYKSGQIEIVKELAPLPKIDLPEKFSIKP